MEHKILLDYQLDQRHRSHHLGSLDLAGSYNAALHVRSIVDDPHCCRRGGLANRLTIGNPFDLVLLH